MSLSDLLHSKKEKHKQILKNILGALEWEKRQLLNNGSYNLSNIVVRTRLLLVSTRPMTEYSPIKTRKYPGDIPQFSKLLQKIKRKIINTIATIWRETVRGNFSFDIICS